LWFYIKQKHSRETFLASFITKQTTTAKTKMGWAMSSY